jgi:hypothetical protein
MTLEDILKRRMKDILLKETPYVIEEARFGMFDLAVYIPEDTAFDGIDESKKLSALRACNKYHLDGTCLDKQKTFLKNFEPVYNEHCFLIGFKDKMNDTTIPEKAFNEMLNDKKIIKKSMSCNLDDEGKGCEYLSKRLEWENGFLAGNGLNKGLHLFEFKSDHDNVNRFLEQLPHYSIFADFIWLVIGKEQKIPKWLPSYVGIFKEDGDSFLKIKDSLYIRRTPPLSKAVLRECMVPENAMDEGMLYGFLRKWLINSIFFKGNGLVLKMEEFDHLFESYDKKDKKKPGQSTLKF